MALGLIVLLALAFNWHAVLSRDQLPASGDGSDLWTSHWGNAAFLKQAVQRSGLIPLWNPNIMSGRPFAADPLAALFYPPMHLVHILPLREFFLLLLVGHLALAGIGAYALGRRGAGLGMDASLLVAVAFMLSPRLIGHYGAGHLTMIMAVAWMPWVALATVLAIRESGRWVAPAGLALGLAILAGHPQIAFYQGLMIGAIAAGGVVRAVARARNGRVRAALRVVGIAAAIGGIGALIGAPLILPALEFTAMSLRDSGLVIHDRLPIDEVLSYLFYVSLHDANPHELTFAPGIPVLLLVPAAFIRRRWLATGLLAGVVLVGILAVGTRTPVLPFLATHVPGFGYFRAPARIWFLAALALPILAGIGLQNLSSDNARLRLSVTSRFTIILLLAVNLWLMDSPFIHVRTVEPGSTPVELEEVAAKLAQGDRVYGLQRNIRQAVVPQLGLELADGQDPLQIAAYSRFIELAGGYHYDGYALAIPPFEVYDPEWETHQQAQPNARVLGLLNVGLVLSRHQLYDTSLVEVAKVDDTFVYRNNAVLPRAFLVRHDVGQDLAGASMDRLAARATMGDLEPGQAPGSASVTGLGPGSLVADVEASQDAYLVIANPWYPGWEARVDGRPARLVRFGEVLQAVEVPAGSHTVRVDYHPTSVRIGLMLAAVGLIATAGWTAWFLRRARRRKASAD